MTREQKIALYRGLVSALITGGIVFLSTWSTTTDVRTLVIATGTAILTPFAARAGVEGYIDSAAAKRKS